MAVQKPCSYLVYVFLGSTAVDEDLHGFKICNVKLRDFRTETQCETEGLLFIQSLTFHITTVSALQFGLTMLNSK